MCAIISLIRKHIFAGSERNHTAPIIFIILCIYAIFISTYTGLFFDTRTTIIRAILSIAIVVIYVVLERSKLSSETVAFLSPTILVSILVFASILFGGDFLLFTYTLCCAMISLTYMKPKGLRRYIIAIGGIQAAVLFIFGQNLLGSAFTMIHNYLYFATSVGMNILTFVFCNSYSKTLLALTEAKDEASRASMAKSVFLSNMSHEIRTPINTIVGMTTIGSSSKTIEETKYALEKIESASVQLLALINNVLDMSKIESDKFKLSYTEFYPEKMLQTVINMISYRMDEKKQIFSYNIDENIPAIIIGDDQRLIQILANLLGNAVKFTPDEGSIALNIRLVNEENNICTIQADVTDSGIGISPRLHDQLFEVFQQADSNTTRKYGGSGLGLPITKKLVEMMGGEIWIESDLGKGATFAFTFLAKRGTYSADGFINVSKDETDGDGGSSDIAAHRMNGIDLSKTFNFKGKCMLLAEDIDINREIIISLLKPTEIAIECAENGTEAVKMFSESPEKYDIIFMDIQMPEMDGFEATQCIRALDIPQGKTIPIIAMTANVFREDIELCLEAGMSDHLGKPLDIRKLLNMLKKYL